MKPVGPTSSSKWQLYCENNQIRWYRVALLHWVDLCHVSRAWPCPGSQLFLSMSNLSVSLEPSCKNETQSLMFANRCGCGCQGKCLSIKNKKYPQAMTGAFSKFSYSVWYDVFVCVESVRNCTKLLLRSCFGPYKYFSNTKVNNYVHNCNLVKFDGVMKISAKAECLNRTVFEVVVKHSVLPVCRRLGMDLIRFSWNLENKAQFFTTMWLRILHQYVT